MVTQLVAARNLRERRLPAVYLDEIAQLRAHPPAHGLDILAGDGQLIRQQTGLVGDPQKFAQRAAADTDEPIAGCPVGQQQVEVDALSQDLLQQVAPRAVERAMGLVRTPEARGVHDLDVEILAQA